MRPHDHPSPKAAPLTSVPKRPRSRLYLIQGGGVHGTKLDAGSPLGILTRTSKSRTGIGVFIGPSLHARLGATFGIQVRYFFFNMI